MIVVAKAVVGRSRPASPIAVITEDGFSFPSGHATGTVAVAVLVRLDDQPVGDPELAGAGWRLWAICSSA